MYVACLVYVGTTWSNYSLDRTQYGNSKGYNKAVYEAN